MIYWLWRNDKVNMSQQCLLWQQHCTLRGSKTKQNTALSWSTAPTFGMLGPKRCILYRLYTESHYKRAGETEEAGLTKRPQTPQVLQWKCLNNNKNKYKQKREIPFFLFTACRRRNGLTLQQGRLGLDIMTSKVLEQIIGKLEFQCCLPLRSAHKHQLGRKLCVADPALKGIMD